MSGLRATGNRAVIVPRAPIEVLVMPIPAPGRASHGRKVLAQAARGGAVRALASAMTEPPGRDGMPVVGQHALTTGMDVWVIGMAV